MTRSLRAAVVALTVGAILTGCTAQPAVTAPGPTATAAAATSFRCPARSEVAALTAVAFTTGTSAADTCAYRTEGASGTTVDVRHPASTTLSTLAAIRAASVDRGVTTTDARPLAFDAFTTTTSRTCTVWFSAVDGVPTSITAQRPGGSGADACTLATAVATLIGPDGGSVPTVAVVAPARLLGTTTAAQAWPYRTAARADARIDRLTGTGYLQSTAATSFAGIAATVPRNSAVVVFVSGTAEAGASRIEVLHAATLALSAAASRAPKAELVVVGPVSDGTVPLADLLTLRDTLRTAAKVAGARFVDPTGGPTAPSSAALAALAVRISAGLGSDLAGR